MRTQLAGLLIIIFCSHSLAQLSDQSKGEIRAMHWTAASGFQLKTSKSAIEGLPGFGLVAEAEARRFRELMDGRSDRELEADAFNGDTHSELLFEWFPEGFINSDDWMDVDSDSFLTQLKEHTAEVNDIRSKKGLNTLTITEWRQKPFLNKDTHTVVWAIDAKDNKGASVTNCVALKLGRYGFEKIVWITNPAVIRDRNDLLTAIDSHHFNDGARYTDYVASTDRAAAYGVAGLVAGVIGVKLLKVAGIGAAIIGLKKFAIILLVPIVYAWRKFVGLFRPKANRSV